jgi:hypothetical protein
VRAFKESAPTRTYSLLINLTNVALAANRNFLKRSMLKKPVEKAVRYPSRNFQQREAFFAPIEKRNILISKCSLRYW